jgi:arginyl-tRNA synthetase
MARSRTQTDTLQDTIRAPRGFPAWQAAGRLNAADIIDKTEIAGPGFINMTLKPAAWFEALRAVLRAGAEYGRSTIGNGSKSNGLFRRRQMLCRIKS